MPGFKVQNLGVQGSWCIQWFLMLDGGDFHGKDIQVFGGGNRSVHKHSIAFVSHPTACGVKVHGVIATFV